MLVSRRVPFLTFSHSHGSVETYIPQMIGGTHFPLNHDCGRKTTCPILSKIAHGERGFQTVGSGHWADGFFRGQKLTTTGIGFFR